MNDNEYNSIPDMYTSMGGSPYQVRFEDILSGEILSVRQPIEFTLRGKTSSQVVETIKIPYTYIPYITGTYSYSGVTKQINGAVSVIDIAGPKLWINDVRPGEVDIASIGFSNDDLKVKLLIYDNAID